MTQADWIALSQIIYNFAGSVAALGTLGAAVYAVVVYKKNSRLERAKWASTLYEKFYERAELKRMRDALDCDKDSEDVAALVKAEGPDFTDYLNFFEFVAFLLRTGQLRLEEVEDLFKYYLGCLQRHADVRRYIHKKGYERLDALLKSRKWK